MKLRSDKHSQSVHDIIGKIHLAADGHIGDNPLDRGGPVSDQWPRPGIFRIPYLDLGRQSYDARELLQFWDRTFVTIAYQALLKREPDPVGHEHFLRLLRNNPSDKLRILAVLRASPEGEARNVTVKGLEWEKFKLQLEKIPLLGKVMRFLFVLGRPRGVKRELARQENRLAQLVEETGEALQFITTRIHLDAKADREGSAEKVDAREMDRYLRSVGHVLDMISEIHTPHQGETPAPKVVDAYSGGWLDELYFSFEDAFRGPGTSIQRQMEVYLPPLREVTARVSFDTPPALPGASTVLDLGCGRGEFLELLAENDIPAMGVDSNRFMVSQGKKTGLNIRQEDIFGFLAELPAECLAAVTAFHVVEHFPFRQQLLLLDQIRRVLLPGGMIILETPNPCNILVGAIDFYRDPTHLRPIHPDTLLFLARSRGFNRAAIYFPNDVGETGPVLEDAAKTEFNELQDYVTVARDYALMAYKC